MLIPVCLLCTSLIQKRYNNVTYLRIEDLDIWCGMGWISWFVIVVEATDKTLWADETTPMLSKLEDIERRLGPTKNKNIHKI